MKDLLGNLSKFITLLSIMFVFTCRFYNNVCADEYINNKYTYDPSPVEGYHKKKIEKTREECEHKFNPEGNFSHSAYVYSDCTCCQ